MGKHSTAVVGLDVGGGYRDSRWQGGEVERGPGGRGHVFVA